jgi:quinol monooxygenase YgiN
MNLHVRLLCLTRLAACLLLLSGTVGLTAQPQQSQQQQPQQPQLTGPGFIVTYVEAFPAKASALAADLTAYARLIESQSAKPQVTLLRESGRPNRMVVLEQWPDVTSSAVAETGTLMATKIQPEIQAPIDRRVNHPLTPVPASSLDLEKSPAFVVLMHVDVGRGASDVPKMLAAQRDAVLAAQGALGYEVAVQDQKANHFALLEVWKSRAAYEAYTATAPAKDLRRQLADLIGAPFDDRFYEGVNH